MANRSPCWIHVSKMAAPQLVVGILLTTIAFSALATETTTTGESENDDRPAALQSTEALGDKTSHPATEQLTCKRITYVELLSDHLQMHRISLSAFPNFDSLSRLNTTEKQRKFTCIPRNTTENETLVRQVQLVSSTDLQQALGSRNESSGVCSVVLFYAPWCPFCAQVAPQFNALARVFPQMNTFAIDAVHFSNLNSRYGTIAVPTILVFHNSRAISRFNNTARDLDTISSFVSNITGFEPNKTVIIEPQDYEGPVSSTPTTDPDHLLYLAWVFVIVFSLIYFAKSSIGKRLLDNMREFGREHHPID